jgi:signal transduction histidine kinase
MPEVRSLHVLIHDGDEASRDAVYESLKAAGIDAEVSEASSEGAVEQERRELRERERVARQEVEAATRVRDEFLATLSHELRTPLNAILGWTRLIAAGSLSPATVERAVSIIERNARAEARLIDRLLDVSRLTAGTVKLDVRAVELTPLLESTADTLYPAARAKKIQLDVDATGAPRRIVCDPARVQQIVWNFLSNAVKFTPPGGHVRVVAKQSDDSVSIEVQDTGVGIKPELLPFVFDRLGHQDGATTRFQGGVGAGLAIARRFAELHGGSVSVASAGEGSGSTFTVTLPLIAQR